MLKINEKTLDHLEKQYPGIRKSILDREKATLPVCSRCGSHDTAVVNCGMVGRTINIAAATTKFKLVPNGPKSGDYFCNTCEQCFN